ERCYAADGADRTGIASNLAGAGRETIMRTTTLMQRNARPVRREAATHLFAFGQAVRLKSGTATFQKPAESNRAPPTPPRSEIRCSTASAATSNFMNGWRRRTVSNRATRRRVIA